MDKERFHSNFTKAVELSIRLAAQLAQRNFSIEAFLVRPSESFDNNMNHGEVSLGGTPLPQGHYIGPLDAASAEDFLYRDGMVPVWVDSFVSPYGKGDGGVLVTLLCAGRYAREDGLLYHLDKGIAPFAVKSPPLASGSDTPSLKVFPGRDHLHDVDKRSH